MAKTKFMSRHRIEKARATLLRARKIKKVAPFRILPLAVWLLNSS